MYFIVYGSEDTLMPNCGCNKACSCTVVANGAPIIIESSDQFSVVLIDVGKTGGPDNIVEGSGRPTDPYSVSFKDSLEYRPRAQEWRQLPYTTEEWTSDPTLYSTPVMNALFLWAPEQEPQLVTSGVLLGAYVDINTGGVGIPLELTIFFGSLLLDNGPARIAQYTGNAPNPIMACTGFLNPARTIIDLSSSGLRAEISVHVRDPADGIVAINEVRLWGVQV